MPTHLSAENAPERVRRPRGRLWLEFLGSMNLAITLLVALAIAAVIGTVLQQNQPYSDYLIKFGPFWFEVFRTLGLYDVYGAGWFLLLLGFLLLSTAACVVRHAPGMVREMRGFRLEVQAKSLRAFHHRRSWLSALPQDTLAERVTRYLSNRGYRVRSRADGEERLLAAQRGAAGRLGYLLSHTAIVVICVGGLIDGNVGLKLKQLTGEVQVERRDLPLSELAPESVLPPDSGAFRGSVSIPEGGSARVVFLGVGEGYLVQSLPFRIELSDFRIAYHETGQPKSFESDLIIHDDTLAEPLARTIAVNHPLRYRGYAIYQSSFADGGSEVSFRGWPIKGEGGEPLPLAGRIGGKYPVATADGPMTLELIDFKLFNIFPIEEESGGKGVRNYGPSVTYRLRNSRGEAQEYVNYLAPVELQGRKFLLSGVRSTPAEGFRYLHIPVDTRGGPDRFLRLRALAADRRLVRGEMLRQLQASGLQGEALERAADSFVGLAAAFAEGGVDAVVAQVGATAPVEQREPLARTAMGILQTLFGVLYLDLLAEEGVEVEQGIGEAEAQFFDDAMNALSLLGPYGSPLYLQPVDFRHVEASGLQITRSPGKPVVYAGCILLMAGVFLMFYVRQRRLWLLLAPGAGGCELLFAGSSHRGGGDFDAEFAQLQRDLLTLSETDA